MKWNEKEKKKNEMLLLAMEITYVWFFFGFFFAVGADTIWNVCVIHDKRPQTHVWWQ